MSGNPSALCGSSRSNTSTARTSGRNTTWAGVHKVISRYDEEKAPEFIDALCIVEFVNKYQNALEEQLSTR